MARLFTPRHLATRRTLVWETTGSIDLLTVTLADLALEAITLRGTIRIRMMAAVSITQEPIAEAFPSADVYPKPARTVSVCRRQSMFKPLSLFLAVLLLSAWTGEFAAQAGTPDELTVKGSTEVPFAVSTDTHAVWSGGALLVAQDRFSGAPVYHVWGGPH